MAKFVLQESPTTVAELEIDDAGDLNLKLNGINVLMVRADGLLELYNVQADQQRFLPDIVFNGLVIKLRGR